MAIIVFKDSIHLKYSSQYHISYKFNSIMYSSQHNLNTEETKIINNVVVFSEKVISFQFQF